MRTPVHLALALSALLSLAACTDQKTPDVGTGGDKPPVTGPDTTAPSVAVTGTLSVGASGVVSLKVNAQDDRPGDVTLNVTRAGEARASGSAAVTVSETLANTTGADVTHEYVVTARDAAGNEARRTVSVTVRGSSSADTTPPTLTLSAGASDIDFGQRIFLKAWAEDDQPLGDGRITITLDGQALPGWRDGGYSDFKKLRSVKTTNDLTGGGVRTYVATVTDLAGNRTVTELSLRLRARVETGDPAVGAPVGSGAGRQKVYVSPSAEDLAILRYTNEFRRMGTIDGEPAVAGTCFEKTFVPMKLPVLTYDGVAAYASTRHAYYLGTFGLETNPNVGSGHVQVKEAGAAFYGATIRDRISRAQTELLGKPVNSALGENIEGGGADAAQAVWDWAKSEDHCENMTDPQHTALGTAMYLNPTTPELGARATPTRVLTKRSWVQLFIFYP